MFAAFPSPRGFVSLGLGRPRFGTITKPPKPYSSIPIYPDFFARLGQTDIFQATDYGYQKFGSVIRVNQGQEEVWVYDPIDVEAAMKHEPAVPHSTAAEVWPLAKAFQEIRPKQTLSPFTVFNDQWYERKFYQKDMEEKVTEQYYGLIESAVKEISENIPSAASDLTTETPKIVLDLCMKIMLGYNPRLFVLGSKADPQDLKYFQCLNSANTANLILLTTASPDNYKDLPAWKDLSQSMAFIRQRSADLAARMGGGGCPVKPYLQRVIERKEIGADYAISDLSNLVFAGSQTLDRFILWVILHLAKNTEVQEKLYQEILREDKKHEAKDKKHEAKDKKHEDKKHDKKHEDKKHDHEDKKHHHDHDHEHKPHFLKYSYLNDCVRESHRLTIQGPFLFGRRFPKDLTVGGYTVPAGSCIRFVLNSIQNDPKLVKDVDKYIPERWSPEEKKKRRGTPSEIIDNPQLAEPFGWGPRNCMGNKVAKLIIKSVVYQLTKDWQFKWTDPKATYKVEFDGMSRANPYPALTFQKRK